MRQLLFTSYFFSVVVRLCWQGLKSLISLFAEKQESTACPPALSRQTILFPQSDTLLCSILLFSAEYYFTPLSNTLLCMVLLFSCKVILSPQRKVFTPQSNTLLLLPERSRPVSLKPLLLLYSAYANNTQFDVSLDNTFCSFQLCI